MNCHTNNFKDKYIFGLYIYNDTTFRRLLSQTVVSFCSIQKSVISSETKNIFKPTISSNHHLPHEHHIANDSSPQQKKLIRTKSQMIKFYSGRLEGLVTSWTKIQMTYICMDERPI